MIFSKNSGEIAAASAGGVIIKDINAMQGFGSMDVLCMDKTGALTNESRYLSVQLRPVSLVGGAPAVLKSVLDVRTNKRYDTSMAIKGKRMRNKQNRPQADDTERSSTGGRFCEY